MCERPTYCRSGVQNPLSVGHSADSDTTFADLRSARPPSYDLDQLGPEVIGSGRQSPRSVGRRHPGLPRHEPSVGSGD